MIYGVQDYGVDQTGENLSICINDKKQTTQAIKYSSCYQMQYVSILLLTISALLGKVAFAQPVKAQSQIQVKKPMSQAQNLQNGLFSSVIFYPRWNEYKKMFNLTFAPSDQARRKKIYLFNVQLAIEDSFQKFPNTYPVSSRFHFSPLEANKPYSNVEPIFSDLVNQYRRVYKSPQQKAYRQKVFAENQKWLPVLTNYSDLTTEEFQQDFLPANLVVDINNYKMLVKYTITVIRNQTEEGYKFPGRKTIQLNLDDPTKSTIGEIKPPGSPPQPSYNQQRLAQLTRTAQAQAQAQAAGQAALRQKQYVYNPANISLNNTPITFTQTPQKITQPYEPLREIPPSANISSLFLNSLPGAGQKLTTFPITPILSPSQRKPVSISPQVAPNVMASQLASRFGSQYSSPTTFSTQAARPQNTFQFSTTPVPSPTSLIPIPSIARTLNYRPLTPLPSNAVPRGFAGN